MTGMNNHNIQIEELLKNGFVLRRDFAHYMLNDKEITAEEYDELWNRVLIYLDNNCEKVDEIDYGVEDVWWSRIGLYRCRFGKVGLFMIGAESHDSIEVYVGNDAWQKVKNLAIDGIKDKIEWLESSGNEELINYLHDVLDEIMHMLE